MLKVSGITRLIWLHRQVWICAKTVVCLKYITFGDIQVIYRTLVNVDNAFRYCWMS